MKRLLYVCVYRLRHPKILNLLRRAFWRVLGMKIGKSTAIGSINVSWPHAVSIGANCTINHGVAFKVDGPYSDRQRITLGKNVFIGENCEFNIQDRLIISDGCLIAAGCRFIDNNHGTAAGSHVRHQANEQAPIVIENDCWLGANVIVLKGVHLGRGVIVGAGAVITHDLPDYAVAAGVPARLIRFRASSLECEKSTH
jgi:acetyltransferase-like isoleucine patch superfamily enzyme